MGRVSNGIITVLNVVTLALALTAIGFSLWFHVKSETLCQRVIRRPLLVVGVVLMVVSLAGLIGSCYRVSFLLWLYLVVLFLFIVGLFLFTAFAIMVTSKSVGKAATHKGIGSLRLGDYSHWLQNHVIIAENWDKIKSCMADVNLCHVKSGKGEDFYKHKLPPILSGCCKPPIYCGLQFQNATYWNMPASGPLVPDPDCKTWSNTQKQLCFDCESCKTAVLDDIRREWRVLAFINLFIMVFIIIVYSVGCCALNNNRKDGRRMNRAYP